METITIRRGRPEDAGHFSRLSLFSAPSFLLHLFGHRVRSYLKNFFRHTRNFFSFEYSYFIEVNGETAGMALLYDYTQKKRNGLLAHLLVLKYLKFGVFPRLKSLLKSAELLDRIAERESYLGNVAIYPRFRGFGFGSRLLKKAEEEAGKAGNRRMVLHAEINNTKAIRLYERLGYRIEEKLPEFKIRGTIFESFKMVKNLEIPSL